MVISVARRFVVSDYTMTLTGSYLRDLEELPGLWSDVYLYLSVKDEEEEFVKKAYAAIDKARGATQDG